MSPYPLSSARSISMPEIIAPMALVVTSTYLWLLLALHLIPLGGQNVSQFTIILFRADYLLHSLVFLPWMPIGYQWLLSLKRQSVSLSVAPGTPAPVSVGFRALVIWLLFGVVSALGLEGLQLLLPYRCFNPLDGAYNLAGVVTGLPLVWVVRRRGAQTSV